MKALTILTRRTLQVVVVVALAAAWLPAQPAYQSFVSAFSKAMSFDDERGMDRAVRNSPRWVTFHYEAVYRQWLKDQSRLDRRKTLTALNASFKRTYDGVDTLDKIAKYYDDLDDERTGMIDNAEQSWYSLTNLWEQVSKERKPEAMRKLVDKAMDLARRFEELGHPLKASESWATVKMYYQALPDHSLADRHDGINAITRFIENRKAWNWTKDPLYHGWVNWLKSERITIEAAAKKEEERKKAGFKEDSKGPAAFLIPGAKEEIGKFQFKVLKKLPRSCFFRGGPVPALWMSVSLGAANSGPTQLAWYRQSDVFLVRPGASKFGVTWDGATSELDKNPWQRIEAPNKITKKPNLFYLDKAKKQQYAMWFYSGSQQEPVVGLTSNLAPNEKWAPIYYRSAASWEATLNGVKVTFLDDNADGKIFTEDPLAFGLKERTLGFGGEEKLVPTYDSMIIGKSKPVPYSSWVKLGDKWFHIRQFGAEGHAVGARPVHTDFFKVGTLQMTWAGKKARPELLVVRGEDTFRSASFDIASGKPVEVPVGKYTITYGRMVQGKGSRVITAQILRGDSEPIEVKENETTVVELGAPFKIDFEWSRDTGFVVVDSVNFKVKGRFGEHYAKISGAVAAPEVLYGKTTDGKGARPVGQFMALADADMLNTAGDTLKAAGSKISSLDVGFFAVAKGDRTYPTKVKFLPKFPDGHVGLRQKKHKLFGKLEANFK